MKRKRLKMILAVMLSLAITAGGCPQAYAVHAEEAVSFDAAVLNTSDNDAGMAAESENDAVVSEDDTRTVSPETADDECASENAAEEACVSDASAVSEESAVTDVSEVSEESAVFGSVSEYDLSAGSVSINESGAFRLRGTTSANTVTVSGAGIVAEITLDSVSIDVSGNENVCAFHIAPGAAVKLMLAGDSTLKSGKNCAGLGVPEGASLEIAGPDSASLTVYGGQTAAGIGGGYGPQEADCGSVTIEGGTVNAYGGANSKGKSYIGAPKKFDGGAGIGGGSGAVSVDKFCIPFMGSSGPRSDCYGVSVIGGDGGTVEIRGGTVNAYGGDGCAGIGTGGVWLGDHLYDTDGIHLLYENYVPLTRADSDAGSVKITGGKVNATGGYRGAGIGGGYLHACGTVSIKGGTVNAKTGKILINTVYYGSGCGIGVGEKGGYGRVEINEGNVTASGSGEYSGIGAETISVNGGRVTASCNGYNACGAGIGSCGFLTSDVTITGGTVDATAGGEYYRANQYCGYGGAAGIGAAYQSLCGRIVINGTAEVTATGGSDGAGIGAGEACYGKYDNAPDIFIGGSAKVTARGGIGGASGGYSGERKGGVGVITITDKATVSAESNYGVAGIGGGRNNAEGSSDITISINGYATVYAKGGCLAAGIGGGNGADGGIITIGGSSSVTAVEGTGAANIGGGNKGKGGIITINDSASVNAILHDASYDMYGAAGIGGGGAKSYMYHNGGSGGIITINGGTVSASRSGGESFGAGIGSGLYCTDNDTVIIINGGDVTASGGSRAAGIGAGAQANDNDYPAESQKPISYGTIMINGGTIHAAGGEYAAGIGGGYNMFVDNSPRKDLGSITITGGDVTATGGDRGAGIGGGNDQNGGHINIGGGNVKATGLGGAAGIGGGKTGYYGGASGLITISGGHVRADAISKTDSGEICCGGAGIGCAAGCNCKDKNRLWLLSSDFIMITGGVVEASGAAGGAGIGGGMGGVYKGGVLSGPITISGDAYVTARGGINAPGIGLGLGLNDIEGGYKTCSTCNLKICGGTVKAYGGERYDGIIYGHYSNRTNDTDDAYFSGIAVYSAEFSGGKVYATGSENAIVLGRVPVSADEVLSMDAVTMKLSAGADANMQKTDLQDGYIGRAGVFTDKECTVSALTAYIAPAGSPVKETIDLTGISWNGSAEYTYNGSKQGPVLSGNIPDEIEAVISGNEAVDAGSYRASARFVLKSWLSEDDYTISGPTELNFDWRIKPADSVVPVNPLPYEQTDISGCRITAIKPQTYDGSEKKPVLKVKLGNIQLEEGVDYRVSYSGNVDAGTDTASAVVTGTGNYKGTASAKFTIKPQNFGTKNIVTAVQDMVFAGNEAKSPVAVYDRTRVRALAEGIDYTVKYSRDDRAGKAKVTVTGTGNYQGSLGSTYRIYPAGTRIISAVSIDVAGNVYDGTAKLQENIKVTDSKGMTVGQENYSVKYRNNKNAGLASVTVTGKKGCKGCVTAYYTVSAARLESLPGIEIAAIKNVTYTGSQIKPRPAVTYKNSSGKTARLSGSYYTLSWSDNAAAGTAKVIVTGRGNYSGTLEKTFSIQARDITRGRGIKVTGIRSMKETGSAIEQEGMKLYCGRHLLLLHRDYEVKYADNVKPGKATITITAVSGGCLSESFNRTFTIRRAR